MKTMRGLKYDLFVNHFYISPEKTDLPKNDNCLNIGWKGASFCPLPLLYTEMKWDFQIFRIAKLLMVQIRNCTR